MSGTFDFDIRNYTITDIEKLFNFKPNVVYKASDVELKEYQLREQLLNSGTINAIYKQDLISFLDSAKKWLMIEKCPETKSIPTTLPNNLQWDSVRYYNSDNTISRQGELINKPPTQYINSFNDDVYAGNLNPLNTRTLTKCMAIDSKFRDNVYSTQASDFTLQLPVKLNKVVSMQISAIEFPVVFYGISAAFGNNFLHIQADCSGCIAVTGHTMVNGNSVATGNTVVSSVRQTIIIPDGNYVAADLVAYMNAQLPGTIPNTDPPIPKDITNPLSFVEFKLDVTTSGSGTGKIIVQPNSAGINTYNVTPDIVLDFTLDINGHPDTVDITSKLGWNLGFTKRKYTGSTWYMGESLCTPMMTRYIYLAIDDYHNNVNDHFISAFNRSTINSNILARLSFRGDEYYTLVANDNLNMVTEPRKYFGPVDIQRLRIRLYDEYGRIVQMNNADFSLCLNFKVIYDL